MKWILPQDNEWISHQLPRPVWEAQRMEGSQQPTIISIYQSIWQLLPRLDWWMAHKNDHYKFPQAMDEIFKLLFFPETQKQFLFMIVQEKWKQQIFTFENLEPDNVLHFCLRNSFYL